MRQRREELWSDATDRLRGMVHASLDVLEQHFADRYDRARFRAASTVLRHVDLCNKNRLGLGPTAELT